MCSCDLILRRVFDPFFSTKPPDQAWGNGLAFAEAVITSHKGAVRARSSLGHGSAIAVYLPLSSSRTAASGSVLGPNRILLVEDSREAINIWQEYLEMEGFEVTSFSDTTRAAEFVAKHIKDFDILITDLSMPGTSGMDLIAQVRALDPRKAVILTTGYYRLEIQAKLNSLGQALMLKKPVKLDTPRSAIHWLMQKSTEG